MSREMIVLIGFVLIVWLLYVIFNAWRQPERACWRCRGASWVKGLSPIFRWPTRGACRSCGGRGWRQRKLSRFFGWDSDIHRR